MKPSTNYSPSRQDCKDRGYSSAFGHENETTVGQLQTSGTSPSGSGQEYERFKRC